MLHLPDNFVFLINPKQKSSLIFLYVQASNNIICHFSCFMQLFKSMRIGLQIIYNF